jgi:hypothetical protein
MADYGSAPTSWYVWLSELSIIPQEYRYIISTISSLFVSSFASDVILAVTVTDRGLGQIILALTPIIPIVALVIYDVILWFWRLAVANWRARSAPRIEIAPAEPPMSPINGAARAGPSNNKPRSAIDLTRPGG